LYNTEALKSAEAQLAVTVEQVERTRKLVNAGTLAKGDLLTVEAQAAAEELAVVNAQNALQMSYLNLTQALDLETPVDFEVEKPDIQVTANDKLMPDPSVILGYAVLNRPEIKAAETRVDASHRGLSIAKGSRSPNLYFTASWGTGYSGANKVGVDPSYSYPVIGHTVGADPINVESYYQQVDYASSKTKDFSDQISDNNNQTLMFNMSIPIFNGWQANSSIQQAKINVQNAQYNLELAKLNLNKIINQAFTDATAAYKKYKSATKKVNATREAFKYSEQKFDVGMITSYEYNDTKKELTRAESELLSAKYEYLFTMTILDFYMGKPISIEKFEVK
jgi:outer membrane protein